jgi:hypothetical protein
MKLTKKSYLIASFLLMLGGAGITALALPSEQEKEVTIKQASSATQSDVTAAPVQTTTEPAAPADKAVTEQPTQSPPSTPAAAPVKPAYGEDPSRPGVLYVFDKTAVMTQAGVPAAEQGAAEQVMAQVNPSWHYFKADDDRYNLCIVTPSSKMSVIADDYKTNPVTQMTWCNKLVLIRYGSWSAILDRAVTTRSIF